MLGFEDARLKEEAEAAAAEAAGADAGGAEAAGPSDEAGEAAGEATTKAEVAPGLVVASPQPVPLTMRALL
jgi:hypothetical protein